MSFPHVPPMVYPFNVFVSTPSANTGPSQGQYLVSPLPSNTAYPTYGTVHPGQLPTLIAIPPGAGPFTLTWQPGLGAAVPHDPAGLPNGQHAPPPTHRDGSASTAGGTGKAFSEPAQRPPSPSPSESTRRGVSYAPATPKATDPGSAATDSAAETATPTAGGSAARSQRDAGTPDEQASTSNRGKTYYSSELNKRKLYGINEYTTWYESHGAHPRRAPPKPIRERVAGLGALCTGRLHVHEHEHGVQVWMWTHDGAGGREPGTARGEWVSVEEGHAHPRLDGYVLHFLDNGDPRWVKPVTAAGYAAGKERRARVAAEE